MHVFEDTKLFDRLSTGLFQIRGVGHSHRPIDARPLVQNEATNNNRQRNISLQSLSQGREAYAPNYSYVPTTTTTTKFPPFSCRRCCHLPRLFRVLVSIGLRRRRLLCYFFFFYWWLMDGWPWRRVFGPNSSHISRSRRSSRGQNSFPSQVSQIKGRKKKEWGGFLLSPLRRKSLRAHCLLLLFTLLDVIFLGKDILLLLPGVVKQS